MITISDAAAQKINEMMKQHCSNTFLRIGVLAGGCTGFSYEMTFDRTQNDQDACIVIKNIRVVLEEEHVKYLNGVEIDFEESGMTGGFTIHNPNATATCGCGQSFRTATDAGKPSDTPC